MRTLVIETATAACSVALIEDGMVIAARHDIVGRGHAERLVPMIAELPDGGRADRLLVDAGPGSFTGIRVGIAAARALAFGWGATVSGYSAPSLIAAAGFARHPEWEALAVVMEGGHGEVFMQAFDHPLRPVSAFASVRPDTAFAMLAGRPAIGNGVRFLGAFQPIGIMVEALPCAADIVLLPAGHYALPPRPIYGRAPDAKPQAA